MADYIDLLITDDDITLDAIGEPVLVEDLACITQDIKHLVRDSRLLLEVVGQRDSGKVSLLLSKLMLLIEADVRLIPGTIKIDRVSLEVFYLTARTYKYGAVHLQVNA